MFNSHNAAIEYCRLMMLNPYDYIPDAQSASKGGVDYNENPATYSTRLDRIMKDIEQHRARNEAINFAGGND